MFPSLFVNNFAFENTFRVVVFFFLSFYRTCVLEIIFNICYLVSMLVIVLLKRFVIAEKIFLYLWWPIQEE